MKKYVEVASTDTRVFVKLILELGAKGATLPDDQGVFKGIVTRTKLEVDEDVLIEPHPAIRVIAAEKKVEEKAETNQETKPAKTTKVATKKAEVKVEDKTED